MNVRLRRAPAGLVLAVLLALAGPVRAAAPVLPAHADTTALVRLIDTHVGRRLAEEKQAPAAPADDAEFVRRVYLDLVGVIPPPARVVSFLDSRAPDKRARLIDEVLADPRFGRHLADLWQHVLLPPRESTAKALDHEPLRAWLAAKFNANTPWDRLVSELLTARGTQKDNGATTFFLANRSPDKMTDTLSRAFLGVQLQCAQCHNHPFTGWKRAEYWGLAAFFLKVQDGAGKKIGKGAIPNVQEVNARGKKKRKNAPDVLIVPARFLDGRQPVLEVKEPYRPVLAKWLTAADNPYFARAMVNRVWAQLLGRGLVWPVDDLQAGNPPSHPELLAALTREFSSGFDVKHLVRAICNSQTYQRSSTPPPGRPADAALFAHRLVRPLTAEQLYDSLAAVLGDPRKKAGKGAPMGKKGGKAGPRAAFVTFFGSTEGADPLEYGAGIPQVLRLMNSAWTSRGEAFVRRTVRRGEPAARNVERLYLAVLSRRPSRAESERLVRYVRAGDARSAYGDVLWALLNCSAFALNH
jgi:hypothetical protein